MSRNFVGGPNYIQLIDAIRGMKAEIEADKYTNQTLADFLSQKLGFKITPGNIAGALKSLEIKRIPKSGAGDLVSLIAELDSRVSALEQVIYTRVKGQ